MENLGKKPKINVLFVLIVALFTVIGYFVGSYHTGKSFQRDRDPVQITRLFPAERHLENLKRITGWSDPEENLINDLISKPDLIPHDPVLGGTMGFYSVDDIHLINDRWMLAWFEDGHIGGYVLLEFKIKEDNEIAWQVLGSYLE